MNNTHCPKSTLDDNKIFVKKDFGYDTIILDKNQQNYAYFSADPSKYTKKSYASDQIKYYNLNQDIPQQLYGFKTKITKTLYMDPQGTMRPQITKEFNTFKDPNMLSFISDTTSVRDDLMSLQQRQPRPIKY